jgi:hypothetical protein
MLALNQMNVTPPSDQSASNHPHPAARFCVNMPMRMCRPALDLAWFLSWATTQQQVMMGFTKGIRS